MRGIASCYTGYASDVDNSSAPLHTRESILNSKEGAAEQQDNGLIKAFDGRFRDWSTFAAHSCVVHHAIESAETFHDEIHQRFGLGRTCCVCPVKRHIWAQFFFESSPFFMRATTENHLGAFLNKTSDDAFPYTPGAAGNDSN